MDISQAVPMFVGSIPLIITIILAIFNNKSGVTELSKRLDDSNKDMSWRLDHSINQISSRLDDYIRVTDKNFDRIDNRLDKIEAKLDLLLQESSKLVR